MAWYDFLNSLGAAGTPWMRPQPRPASGAVGGMAPAASAASDIPRMPTSWPATAWPNVSPGWGTSSAGAPMEAPSSIPGSVNLPNPISAQPQQTTDWTAPSASRATRTVPVPFFNPDYSGMGSMFSGLGKYYAGQAPLASIMNSRYPSPSQTSDDLMNQFWRVNSANQQASLATKAMNLQLMLGQQRMAVADRLAQALTGGMSSLMNTPTVSANQAASNNQNVALNNQGAIYDQLLSSLGGAAMAGPQAISGFQGNGVSATPGRIDPGVDTQGMVENAALMVPAKGRLAGLANRTIPTISKGDKGKQALFQQALTGATAGSLGRFQRATRKAEAENTLQSQTARSEATNAMLRMLAQIYQSALGETNARDQLSLAALGGVGSFV